MSNSSKSVGCMYRVKVASVVFVLCLSGFRCDVIFSTILYLFRPNSCEKVKQLRKSYLSLLCQGLGLCLRKTVFV